MKWPIISLGDLCDLVNGKAYNVSDWSTEGLPIVRIQNLNDHSKPFNYWSGSSDREVIVKDNDILLAWSGTPGTSFGAHVWTRGLGVLNQHIFRLDLDYSRITRNWAVRCINHQLHRLIEQAHGGVGLQHVTKPMVQGLAIPLPSLSEQRRIAAILDKADAIRRKREKGILLTDELIRSTFLKMVGPANTDYKKWTEYRIEKLAAHTVNSMRTGPFGSSLLHSEFVEEGIPVLGIDNAVKNRFTWNERRFITPEKYHDMRRYTAYPGDVIVTIMGTTGRSAVLPDDLPTAITTKHLATITVNRSLILPEILSESIFLNPLVLSQIKSASRGAIMDGLNLGIIRKLTIHTPPLTQQERYLSVRKKLLECVRKRQDAGSESTSMFNSLVDRAFRGEL